MWFGRDRSLRAASCATPYGLSTVCRSVTRFDRTPIAFVPTFNENCWPWLKPRRHRLHPLPFQFRHRPNEMP
jgi:hypothetical protein